jgi:beta-ribofuranosylaminobenzene 5'-phosphate synthase
VRGVRIVAPAHLHAGNLDLSGGLGRGYGTVGFTVEEPRLEVRAVRDEGISSNLPEARRVASLLVRRWGTGGVRLEVRSGIIPYAGLGYHTTLALSVGRALSELYGLGKGLEEVALTVRRGLLTALGLYACKVGGFLVEGGFRVGEEDRMVPPLLFRFELPREWRFVIAVPWGPLPEIARKREEREGEILREVGMSGEVSGNLCRIVLLRLLPAMAEGELEEFGRALTEFNRTLGGVWSRYQAGRYCSRVVEEGIKRMEGRASCACQSSWGPAFYGIVEGRRRAEELAGEMRSFLEERGGGRVFLTRGRNRGMEVRG